MLRTLFSPNKTALPAIAEPVALGGTGAKDTATALVNIQAVPLASIGVASGVAPIGADGFIKDEFLPPRGSSSNTSVDMLDSIVYVGSEGKFMITNYDSERVYTIQPIQGNVDIVTYDDYVAALANYYSGYYGAADLPGTIVYTPPGPPVPDSTAQVVSWDPTALGPIGFTLNEQEYLLQLMQPYVERPTIYSPAANATIDKAAVSILSTPFNLIGMPPSADSFKSSTVQLAFDADFTLGLHEINGYGSTSAGNHGETVISGLQQNKVYYVRVKYETYNHGWSDWSLPVSFLTAASFAPLLPTTRLYNLMGSSAASDEPNGGSLACSADGTRVVFSGPVYDWNGYVQPSAYVKRFSPGNQSLEDEVMVGGGNVNDVKNTIGTAQLVGPYYPSARFDVNTLSMSGDGLTFCTGTKVYRYDGTNWYVSLSLDHYEYVDTGPGSWVFEQDPQSVIALSTTFNQPLTSALSYDGNTLVISAPDNNGASNNGGRITVFNCVNGTWVQSATLSIETVDYNPNNWSDWICQLSMSDDGMRICVGIDINVNKTVKASAVVFTLLNGVWTQEALIVLPGTVYDTYTGTGEFSGKIAMNRNGDTIIVGNAVDVQNGINSGSLHIYERTGTVWDYKAMLLPQDQQANQNFGLFANINGDGNLIGVGCVFETDAFNVPDGVVYYFNKITGVWSQATTLSDDQAQWYNGNAWFGSAFAFSASGDIAYISARNYPMYNGMVEQYIYTP